MAWYTENRRPLPWRATTAPYPVWLSEVVLQQTRVDQGTAYWQRFMARWPTVHDLAGATEDEVLREWQGLGYYSRARNLLRAARQVADGHGGRFPRTYAGLLGLPGVGAYIAAAVGSICFGLPRAVVDGNVYRVLARFAGIDTPIDSTAGRKVFGALATELLDPARPGDHNQAVMELGALVCTPQRPACPACPLRTRCAALATGHVERLPVKAGRTKVRERHFNFLLFRGRRGVRLQKRAAKDIWAGLYQPPLIETGRQTGPKGMLRQLRALHPGAWAVRRAAPPVVHLLSHQRLHITFWEVAPPRGFRAPGDWTWVPAAHLGRYALPRPVERHLAPPTPA
jgi:A/G-specific adenine glycosylase